MALVKTNYTSYPKLGEGIYSPADIANILQLPYHKVNVLIRGFWQVKTVGRDRNKSVNFLSLIEFYIYYFLREKGISAQKIKKLHSLLSKDFNTKYPFASLKIRTQKKEIWVDYLGQLLKADGKLQPAFRTFIEEYLSNVEYGNDSLAKRYYPLTTSRNVVIDPSHQFGQPVINGTNLQTKAIYSLYQAGESKSNICILYEISEIQVNDAITYYTRAA